LYKYKASAAIDLGTHGTGFSWAVHESKNDTPSQRTINHCQNWKSQPGPCAKNLTALLLDDFGEVVAWGYEARRRWLTAGPNARQGWRYYAGFKMDLMPRCFTAMIG
jgi:hypothetical protein